MSLSISDIVNVELVEQGSEQVFIFLDKILEEKNELVMKEAAKKLFEGK